MSVQSIKQEVMEYVNLLDEDKIQLTLIFIKDLIKEKVFTQTEEQHQLDSIKAFNELESMNFTLKEKVSQDGRSERTNAIWSKYESLA